MIYPKARAPLTPAVYAAANQRAERWRQRTITAREERDALRSEVEELKERLKKATRT